MTDRVLFDGNGRSIRLGAEIGRGGEGKIYEIEGAQRRPQVAKLWYSDVVREPTALAAVAVRLSDGWPDPRRHRRLAPILMFVHDGDGKVVGVVLERLPAGYVVLSDLLTSADRRRAGLAATPHWQLRVAARVADIVARAHDAGLVIGDLTPRNFVVVPGRARVSAFDTDAWQTLERPIETRRITPDALAPEQLSSHTHVPSLEADRWALAVAIVQILLDGRHPCDGVRAGDETGLALVEENVRDGYSHFSPVALRAVHGSPRLEFFSPRVRRQVEFAFGPGHLDPGRRPGARDWVQALRNDDPELVGCDSDLPAPTQNHRVHPGADCVGCAMIGAGLEDPYAR